MPWTKKQKAALALRASGKATTAFAGMSPQTAKRELKQPTRKKVSRKK